MKQFRLLVAGILLVGIAGIYSCKKNDNTVADDAAAQQNSAVDASNVSTATNKAMDDANAALSNVGSINGRYDGWRNTVCGATIDTTQKAANKITITYDGITACDDGRIRSGQIVITLSGAKKWKEIGASITVNFIDFTVTNSAEKKSIILNGSHTVTNISGGIVWVSTNVVHEANGDLTIKFEDGTTRKWTVSRRITYTTSGLGLKNIKVEGIGGADGTTVLKGTNRNNESFEVKIPTAIQANSTCGFHKPISGVQVHKGISREMTVTFGVDAAGNSINAGCAYGFKANWTNVKGELKQRIIAY